MNLEALRVLLRLQDNGVKIVILNGFKESLEYVMSLEDVVHTGTTKSDDGYSEIECFETI